jgi:hypothetical protein
MPQVPKMPKLGGAEKQAMRYIKNPKGWVTASPKVKSLLAQPSPKLQMHLDYNPALRPNHHLIQQQLTGFAGPSVRQASPAEQRAMHQRAVKLANEKPMTEGIPGVPVFNNPALAWGQRLVGGLGQSTIDAGVGVTHLPSAIYHHPLGTPEAMAKNVGSSMLGMVTHPGREFVTNPAEGVTNLATILSLGAGAVARGAKATEVLGAAARGEATTGETAKALGGALYRTPRMERSLKPLPGPSNVRLHPPAFKSSLGGYLHTKVWDPFLEKSVEARATGNEPLQIMGKNIPGWAKGSAKASGFAEKHMGKLMRRDVEMRTQMERGGMEARLADELKAKGLLLPGPKGIKGRISRVYHPDPELAKAQAEAYAHHAATSHAELWHSLRDGGASPKAFEKNPNAYYGVIKPPASWSPKDIEKYSSERQIFHQWNRTVETDITKLKADPDAYTYIPKAMWQRLRPGERSMGDPVVKGMNWIDAGNQFIRSGRFIHPGYAAWAVQNGVLHLSQAGMHVFRNVHQLRNEFPKMSHEMAAKFDNSVGAGHFGGGIARATAGGEESIGRATTKGLGRFWHNIDDKIPRRLALIHELNRMGYHNADDWVKLMKENPRKFRSIAQKAQHQAIDYAEMSPTERATMQKLFTAYGWTRGASTFTARFGLEHPVQATLLNEQAREGQKQRDDFWSKQGGIVPEWLRGSMPLNIGGKHPGLLGTGDINPGETLGQSLGTLGLLPGPSEDPSQSLGPAAQGVFEGIMGRDRFGNQIKGGLIGRLQQAVSDTARRFTPGSYLNAFTRSKKGGGTFLQGPRAGAFGFLGIPYNQLRDPKTTAALGMKDWEQSLPKPEEIQFRHDYRLQQLPKQLALYRQKNGTPLDRGSIAQLKGDITAKERLDTFQYQYAAAKGVHSFRSLPAIDKAKAGIKFMLDNHYFTQSDARDAQAYINSAKTEPDMSQAASDIWSSHPIGQTLNEWESMIKQLTPAPLEAGRG